MDAADVLRLIDFDAVSPWRGHVWRCHAASRSYDDWYGSVIGNGGRYNIGFETSQEDAFPALYTALESGAAVLEILRHLLDDDVRDQFSRMEVIALLRSLSRRSLTELTVDLDRVLDLSKFLIPPAFLLSDASYEPTREIGRVAHEAGVEALLVPSASRVSTNLVIFPWNVPFFRHEVLRRLDGLTAIMG